MQCSVTTQRWGIGWEVGGRFTRDGTYIYLWLIQVGTWCKAIILQFKISKFKQKTKIITKKERHETCKHLAQAIPWRRKWQPTSSTPLPGKSHGLRTLVGYSPWGRKELDTAE